jgi:phosphate transport system permease protein
LTSITSPQSDAPGGGPSQAAERRAKALRRAARGDGVARTVLAVLAFIPAAALAFLAYELIKWAYPSIIFNGTSFFTGKTFTIGHTYSGQTITRHGYTASAGAQFGIAPLIFGTLVSSLIALVLAVPISVGGAIMLVERLPARLQGFLSVTLEILAGIPSVVFGLWGVFTFGPFLAHNIYPKIADLGIPWMGRPTGSGQGLLTSSLVLCVMIIPIVAATTRELVRSVPNTTREGAVALGLTGSESVRLVTIPFIRTGVVAAALLGWGRALGETLAVLLISGNLLGAYPHNIFSPFSTMAATIAALLDSSLQDTTGMGLHALAELGLVLLVITLITNFAGRIISRRFADAGLPVGRGV